MEIINKLDKGLGIILNVFEIDIDFIRNLFEQNIQIIGIFIAIIGGLVATKIISLKTEKDEIKNNIEELESELEQVNIKKINVLKRNLELFKEEYLEIFVELANNEKVSEEQKKEIFNNQLTKNISIEEKFEYLKYIEKLMNDNEEELRNSYKNGMNLEQFKLDPKSLKYKILEEILYTRMEEK